MQHVLKFHFCCLVGSLLLLSLYHPAEAQVSVSSDVQQGRDLAAAIESAEGLLAKYPDNDFAPNLMYQLSELYLKRSTLKFQREMLVYEEAERKMEAGLIDKMPDIPYLDLTEAIATSREILERFPSVHFYDKILYRIALYYSQQGDKARAAEYYVKLVEATTDADLLEECYFRLGEYYFDQKDYVATIKYYSQVLESWDNPFFDMALYKLGWSYYNVEDYRKAISTLVYLIEDVEMLRDVEAGSVDKSKADLRQEAIEYIAICFAEFGGPYKAGDFLSQRRDKAYAVEVLEHLAKIQRERSFYEDAIETLNILLDFYPLSIGAADYQKQVVESYELLGAAETADRERAKFVEKYGPGTRWMESQSDESVRESVVKTGEGYLYRLGTEAQLRAQSKQDSLEYQQAIGWYKFYLEKFATHERAHKVQFYLAESYFEAGDLKSAAESYYELFLSYPGSEFSETAAYHRILAYSQLLENESRADSADFFLFNFLAKGASAVDIIKADNTVQAQLMQASNDFYIFYPFSPSAQSVLMNFGQMLFDIQRYDMAKEVYREVMKQPEQNPFLVRAHFMAGQCDYRVQNYEKAEKALTQLTLLFPDSARYVGPAKKLIASSQFHKAESYLANGDTLVAALAFEDVASSAPDTAVAERALIEAATYYDAQGVKSKAITLYEELADKFPASAHVAQSLFKAAVLSEATEQWARAAANYLRVYNVDRQAKSAPEALSGAARSYEAAADYQQAMRYYGEYAKHYRDDPDRVLEAAFRRAEIAYTQLDAESAEAELSNVVETHRKFAGSGLQPETYLVAQAQFLLAEMLFKEFLEIKLTPPVERKLKRKRTAFQRVVAAYTTAAKYKVAEWTTAASFKIGRCFEEFADAILAAPRPENLTADALEQYDRKLRESVLPFKEKAQKAYEANLKNATENRIDNNWVTESQKRLDALRIELGLEPLHSRVGSDS